MLQRFRYQTYTNVQQHSVVLQKFSAIEKVFQHPASIISKSDQSDVFKHVLGEQSYFIKRYYKTRGLLSWFGFSRFRTEVRNQYWFNQMAVSSAKLVSSGEKHFLFKTTKAFLITQGLDNTRDLAFIATHSPEFFTNSRSVKSLLSKTARILRTLHAHHFCHNDLHWRNLLVRETTEGVDVFLIDCPSGHFLSRPFFYYKQVKDLANLDKVAPQFFSRTQRMRFFFVYRGITKLNNEDKQLILNIIRHKRHRTIRKQKTGLSLYWYQLKFTFSRLHY